jgi:hypothetical protein
MADVADFERLVGREHGLSVVSTLRADQTIQATVVNCGVLDHPVRVGWEWVTAEGPIELAGPDDPLDGLGPDGLRLLLRAVFSSAGGSHEDWDTYDRVMAQEQRAAVLMSPERIYSNR